MENEQKYYDEDFIINLTIDGTSFKEAEVKVTDPTWPIRNILSKIIDVFNLPQKDNYEQPIQYQLAHIKHGKDQILEYTDKKGKELCLLDYNVQSGDSLHIISTSFLNLSMNSYSKTADIEIIDEDFIVNLTIEGTSHENIPVKVKNPTKTIRDQISSIVQVFELPKMDNGGNRIQYLLGQMMNDGDEPEILEFEDENGHEQSLLDYNVQPGDHLHLISVPITVPYVVLTKITIINKSLYIKDIIDEEMRRYGYSNTGRYSFTGKGAEYEKSKLIIEPKRENRQEQRYIEATIIEDRPEYLELLFEKHSIEISYKEEDTVVYSEIYHYSQKHGRYYCVRDCFLSKLPPELLYDEFGGIHDPMVLDQFQGKKGCKLCDYEDKKETNSINDYYIYTNGPHPKWGKKPFIKRLHHLIFNAIHNNR